MDMQQYNEMKSHLFEILDARYQKIEDCDKKVDKFDGILNKDNVRLTVIEHQQRINNWLTLGIAGGIVALVIKVFLGG